MLSLGNKFVPNLYTETLMPQPLTIQRKVEIGYSIHFEKLKSDVSSGREFQYTQTCGLVR